MTTVNVRFLGWIFFVSVLFATYAVIMFSAVW